jgi:hypothetical protein
MSSIPFMLCVAARHLSRSLVFRQVIHDGCISWSANFSLPSASVGKLKFALQLVS